MLTTAPDPAQCGATINPTYRAGTFNLFLRESGAATEFSVGSVDAGNFDFDPTLLEHRDGVNNSLDSILRTGTDYSIGFTTHSFGIRMLAAILNEDFVEVAGECRIPLRGEQCVPVFGVRMVGPFPCNGRFFEIIFWKGALISPSSISFTREGWTEIPGTIRALDCSSDHPTEEYGRVSINEPCPSS